MYKLVKVELPEGQKLGSYIRELYLNNDEETAKDLIFRLTYPYILNELKRKYSNLTNTDDGITSASIAFMKTFKHYDPNKEDGSFMAYYKLALKSQIINDVFRNYRDKPETRELLFKVERSMTYLDEPVVGKDDDESKTKADTTIGSTDIEEDIYLLEMSDRIHKVIADMFTEAPRHKKTSEDIFYHYMNTCINGDPESYTDIAKKFGSTCSTIRKICVNYKELFLNKWEEMGYDR